MSYSDNLLVENRNGLIVNAMAWEATGTAERDTALLMLEQIAASKRVTGDGNKGFDPADFIAECRHLQVTPHVAQSDGRRGGSAIDQHLTWDRIGRLNKIPNTLFPCWAERRRFTLPQACTLTGIRIGWAVPGWR